MDDMAPRSDGSGIPAVTPLVVLKQIMAFCLLLKPHKTPAERLSEKTGMTHSHARDVVAKAKNGCQRAQQLLENKINYKVKFPGEFRINWVEEELPEDIIVLIAHKVRQVSLKRYSAASIIRYHWLVYCLVENGGDKEGIPCAECGTMCLNPYRIACYDKETENRFYASGPYLANRYYDGAEDDLYFFYTEEPHQWFCKDCHNNHEFHLCPHGYNGCKCGIY